jgi:hypothetical protein
MEIPDGSGYTWVMEKNPKRPRDPSQLAKLIVDIASGEVSDASLPSEKDPAAVARGRVGGFRGGKARAQKLTAEQRQQQALKAARSRWNRT